MAVNKPSAYGRDVRCVNDADALWTDVTGLDVVKQDAIHRLTNDTVLGPGGDGWGFDCRKLVGLNPSELSAYQPVLSTVLQQDDRIDAADVLLTVVTTNGLADVRIAVTCYTAEGPFEFIKNVSELTAADIEEQGA